MTVFNDHGEKTCLILGANTFIGRKLTGFLEDRKIAAALMDIDAHADRNMASRNEERYRTISSGDEKDVARAVEELEKSLGGIDYLVCNYYLEDLRSSMEPSDLVSERWDELLEEWVLNYFLVLKAAVPRMIARGGGRVVFFNSTRGYTGEGEGDGHLSSGGSIHEAGCSSGITGMMTSIARDVIPKGISVNGISLGNDFQDRWSEIAWALDLWLSGMGDYSCGQNYRVY